MFNFYSEKFNTYKIIRPKSMQAAADIDLPGDEPASWHPCSSHRMYGTAHRRSSFWRRSPGRLCCCQHCISFEESTTTRASCQRTAVADRGAHYPATGLRPWALPYPATGLRLSLTPDFSYSNRVIGETPTLQYRPV